MKTNQITSMIALFALLTGLGSCSDTIFLTGNGNVQTQNRPITGFDAIASGGDYQISILPGAKFSVQVIAESNLLPYIETQVSGKTLKIGTTGIHSLRHNEPIEISITQPTLTGLNLSGSGLIKTGSFTCDNLQISISGSGDIDAEVSAKNIQANVSGSGSVYLTGDAFQSDFRISGSGKIKTYDLVQSICQTSVSGSGDMYVNVTQTLSAAISGSGRIYYIGHPIVQARISGSGKVVDQN